MKTGFVTLVGRPNAGKSTLLNQILDRKIAIVSDKAQTTRHRITGVLTNETGQIVFLDTPGIHKPRHKLGERMVEIAQSSLYDADVIYYLVDVNNDFGPGEQYILNQLQKTDVPVFLILNKIDHHALMVFFDSIQIYWCLKNHQFLIVPFQEDLSFLLFLEFQLQSYLQL